ncbi:MAG: alpha/beta hydrolase fold domain-containing protein [Mariniblastus sp.]
MNDTQNWIPSYIRTCLTTFVAIAVVSFDSYLHCQETSSQAREVPSTIEPVTTAEDDVRSSEEDGKPKEARKPKLKFIKNGGVVFKKTAEYELKCDVYVPEGDGPFPAILAVHGGFWRAGSKVAMLRHAWRMARAGYVVVAINYRHAPKYPFPAQIHDCKHAVRWMKENKSTYKIDADRIGAFGYSAGGHLAALLGTTEATDGLEGPVESGHEEYSTRVKVVAAGGAPFEFSWISENSPVLMYWLGGTKKQKPKTFRAASPMTFVTPDDPPFYLFHGQSDFVVPRDTAKNMHNRLLAVGIESKYDVAKGSGHVATFSDLTWMNNAIVFFDKHLKNPKK